jgi:hypothetical protein
MRAASCRAPIGAAKTRTTTTSECWRCNFETSTSGLLDTTRAFSSPSSRLVGSTTATTFSLRSIPSQKGGCTWKTSSEYIQATSRVGRAYPGLVVTCLNASRPRDRSHYERFCAYHASFYRDVEATSVTPFSLQTLDRGMVGTLISMLRHGIIELEPPRGVMHIHEHRRLAEEVLGALVKRGREHREWHDAEAETRIAAELLSRGKHFLDAWEKVVSRAVGSAAERTWSRQDNGPSRKSRGVT